MMLSKIAFAAVASASSPSGVVPRSAPTDALPLRFAGEAATAMAAQQGSRSVTNHAGLAEAGDPRYMAPDFVEQEQPDTISTASASGDMVAPPAATDATDAGSETPTWDVEDGISRVAAAGAAFAEDPMADLPALERPTDADVAEADKMMDELGLPAEEKAAMDAMMAAAQAGETPSDEMIQKAQRAGEHIGNKAMDEVGLPADEQAALVKMWHLVEA